MIESNPSSPCSAPITSLQQTPHAQEQDNHFRPLLDNFHIYTDPKDKDRIKSKKLAESEIMADEELDKRLSCLLEVYRKTQQENFNSLKERYDTIKSEYDTLDGVQEMLLSSAVNNPAVEPLLLSILQLLLLVPEEITIRRAYLKLLESCVSEVVLPKNAIDPDFESKFHSQTHSNQLIESLQDEAMGRKLQEAVCQKQEVMVKANQYWEKLNEFKKETQLLRKHISDPSSTPLPPATECNLPEPASISASASADSAAKPSSSIPPAPPPPPFGNLPKVIGGPPPPPPGLLGGSIPPPSPSFMATPLVSALPDYLPPKKSRHVDVPMRKPPVGSFTIDPKSIEKDSFWTRTEEDTLLNSKALDTLKAKFASKTLMRSSNGYHLEHDDGQPPRRVKTPLFIQDDKVLQRLGIVQGSVKMSYKDLKLAILEVNVSKLSDDLEKLRSALPPGDVLKKLAEVSKEQYSEMPEGEQFAACLAQIPALPLRLELIHFHMHFKASVDEIKTTLSCVSEACDELRGSEAFSSLLSIVLGMCNYMSASSKNHKDMYAFEMRMLPKLIDTKDAEGRGTLLHHLCSHLRSLPSPSQAKDAAKDLAKAVAQDLYHCPQAARVNPDELHKLVASFRSNTKKLENSLMNYETQGEHDRFEEVMRPFLAEAKTELETIERLNSKMNSDWAGLAKYFAFDQKKYKMEEFFKDLRKFKEQWEQVMRELDAEIAEAKRREEKEKRRAQEAASRDKKAGGRRTPREKTSPVKSNIPLERLGAFDELEGRLMNEAGLMSLLTRNRASRTVPKRMKIAGKHSPIRPQRSRLGGLDPSLFSPSRSRRAPSPPHSPLSTSTTNHTPPNNTLVLQRTSKSDGSAATPVMRVKRRGVPAVPIGEAFHQAIFDETPLSHNLKKRQNKSPNGMMRREQTTTAGDKGWDEGAETQKENRDSRVSTVEEIITTSFDQLKLE